MIIVCGPFPPPVHGMSKNLLIFKEKLEKQGAHVVPIDISPGGLVRGISYHLTKIKKVFLAVCKIAKMQKQTDLKFYMPPDGGYGIIYSILLTTSALIKGCEVYLHHRSYAYINNKSVLMKILCNLSKHKITHIFLSDGMAKDFSENYSVQNYFIVSNLIHVKPWFDTLSLDKNNYKLDGVLRFGFLSNISFEKGFRDAVNTVLALNNQGVAASLKVGGVCDNAEVQAYCDEVTRLYPEMIKIEGFVDKERKRNFFSDIDWFLFPTRYKNEAQPNVLFESVAAGIPFMTIERGCIKGDFKDYAFVFDHTEDFVKIAVENILKNLNENAYYKIREDLITHSKSNLNKAVFDEKIMYENVLEEN